jgi:hypothetical protein
MFANNYLIPDARRLLYLNAHANRYYVLSFASHAGSTISIRVAYFKKGVKTPETASRTFPEVPSLEELETFVEQVRRPIGQA